MSESEIDTVSRYVLSRKTIPKEDIDETYRGRANLGMIRFESRCGGCHGIGGEYEVDMIGPTLSSPQFISYASEEFLKTTIVNGRNGTAMPSWYFLKDKEVKDIIAYVVRENSKFPSLAETKTEMKRPGAAERGQAIFRGRCAACHGFEAEGRLGPSLKSPELQALASDQFLYQAIMHGRRGTAMGAWKHISTRDAGALMAYLRSFESGVVRSHAKVAVGSESAGRDVFARVCAQCHGHEGIGLIAPAIGGRQFLESSDDRFLRETISYGRTETPMRANLSGTHGMADLSAQDIDDTITYMRTLQKKTFSTIGKSVSQGDIATGRSMFARNCAQCHGDFGGGESGPAIGRPTFLSTVSDGFIEGTIANGRSGTEMRGFSPGQDALGELGEADIRAIVAYLRSAEDAHLIRAKRVQGTASNGHQLFDRQCAQCHGTRQENGFAPRLSSSGFLNAVSDAYLQAIMSMGHGDSMRSMIRGGGGIVEMTGSEINDIISYLRQQNEKE
ncbi:MAG: c-type cytochrome [Kiritimatiellia bacterium]|nr:c-type cytochrome [Kiritimatiellia bacterium]